VSFSTKKHKDHKLKFPKSAGAVSFRFGKFCVFCAVLRQFLGFVGGDALGEGIPMDSKDRGGFGEVLFVAGERLFYIELLEFTQSLVKKDVAFEHFVDEAFESGSNQSSLPVNNL
jgi:hypothetical protein